MVGFIADVVDVKKPQLTIGYSAALTREEKPPVGADTLLRIYKS